MPSSTTLASLLLAGAASAVAQITIQPSASTTLCAQPQHASMVEGTALVLGGCHAAQPEQQFFVDNDLVRVFSNMCVAVAADGKIGDPLVIATCNGHDNNQIWAFNDITGVFVNQGLGSCMSLIHDAANVGSALTVSACTPGDAGQVWTLTGSNAPVPPPSTGAPVPPSTTSLPVPPSTTGLPVTSDPVPPPASTGIPIPTGDPVPPVTTAAPVPPSTTPAPPPPPPASAPLPTDPPVTAPLPPLPSLPTLPMPPVTTAPAPAPPVTTTPAPPTTTGAPVPPPSGQGKTIHPQHNGHFCLTASDNKDGAAVEISTCKGGDESQLWTATGPTLRVFGDKCLDITDGKNEKGTKLQIWTCIDGGSNQAFSETPDRHIEWLHFDKCLDVTNGLYKDGTPVQIWSCSASTKNQNWLIV